MNRFIQACKLRAAGMVEIGQAANQKAEARNLVQQFDHLIREAEVGKRFAEQWAKEGPG